MSVSVAVTMIPSPLAIVAMIVLMGYLNHVYSKKKVDL